MHLSVKCLFFSSYQKYVGKFTCLFVNDEKEEPVKLQTISCEMTE